MDKFRFNGRAQITHLNTRKEGPDDDKVLAVDIKLATDIDSELLRFFDELIVDFLYTDAGAVRNLALGPLSFTHELEHYRLDFNDGTHFGVRVKKFVIDPRDGWKAGLTFQVSFQPSADEVARMAEYLQDEISLALEPESMELDLKEAA